MSTAQATDSAVQLRARRISALIMTTGVVGPSLGVIAGRIFSAESFLGSPGPNFFPIYGTAAVIFAALPFVGLAVLTRRSVCKAGRWSAFWIGAFVGGLVVSVLQCAVLVSALEILSPVLGGVELSLVILPSLAMLLGGAIGWILGRAISWFRQRTA